MKILLPVDGSEHSAQACRALVSRLWAAGTQVRVLHVLPLLAFPAPNIDSNDMSLAASPNGPYSPSTMMEARAQLQQQAERLADRVAQMLQAAKLQVDTRIREGDPRAEILAEAVEWDADLIVLASHGYTGFKRWLLGSVAHSIVSHAPCSVEIVRQKADHPPTV
jgi:nucleotide-binding universal stress UspA family protein